MLIACNDPAFFAISKEIKIPPPIIPGSPTDFAEIDNFIYVGSGTAIHKYDMETANENRLCIECDSVQPYWLQSCTTCKSKLKKIQPWSKENFNLGRITCLTSVNSQLYILTLLSNGTSNIYISNSFEPLSFNPTPITHSDYRFITMYSSNNQIFIGAMDRSGSNYTVFRLTGTTLEEIIFNDTEFDTTQKLLNGVAFNGTSYFLSVKDQRSRNGGGIYLLNGNTAALVPVNDERFINDYSIPFMGIIDIDNTNVIAIDRNGRIYKVNSDFIETYKVLRIVDEVEVESELTTGRLSNGILYVANAFDSDAKMLLAGRQDSLSVSVNTRFTYGYMEILLEGNQIFPHSSFLEPGRTGNDAPSTLPRISGSHDRYRTTIGAHSLKHFFLSSNNILFASTHNNGVWVLRDWNNNNAPYWNAEN